MDLEGFKVQSQPVKRENHHGSKVIEHDPNEVSFILERGFPDAINGGGPNSSGSKFGLFSIALVMCVCCLQQFFSPSSNSGTPFGSLASGTNSASTKGING